MKNNSKIYAICLLVAGVLYMCLGVLVSFAAKSSAWLIHAGSARQRTGVVISVVESELGDEDDPQVPAQPEPDSDVSGDTDAQE